MERGSNRSRMQSRRGENSSTSACDAVVPKFADSKLMVVSVYTLIPDEDEKVDETTAGLNPCQLDCIKTHCRDIHHGINVILGPFGSGKTVLVSKLCELQKLRDLSRKTSSQLFPTVHATPFSPNLQILS